MPRKETAQLELTEPVTHLEKLQTEIQGFQNEIERLRKQLTELRPTPSPHPDLDPPAYAQAVINGSGELEQLQARSRGIKNAIAEMERIITAKEAELGELLRAQEMEAASIRCTQAVSELRSLSAEINEIGELLTSKFHQVKALAQEFDSDYRTAHPIPVGMGLGWQRTELMKFKWVTLPKLIEQQGERFEIDTFYLNILQEEQDALRAERAAVEAQASARATAQGEQRLRQVELMRLEERRKNLRASLDAKRQELSSLEAEKAKWSGNPRMNFHRVDAAINQKTIEAEETAKQIDVVTADIERG